MNPVDHPHGGVSSPRGHGEQLAIDTDACRRVTTNISVRRRPFPDTQPRARRLVSLPREGRVCFVVLRRSRTRGQAFVEMSLGWCYCGLLASIVDTAASRSPVAQTSTWTFGARDVFQALAAPCRDEKTVPRAGQGFVVVGCEVGLVARDEQTDVSVGRALGAIANHSHQLRK